jgi:hypothetical protein
MLVKQDEGLHVIKQVLRLSSLDWITPASLIRFHATLSYYYNQLAVQEDVFLACINKLYTAAFRGLAASQQLQIHRQQLLV